VRELGDDNYIIYGDMQLDEFNTFFNKNIFSNDSDTIGGYIIEQLSSLPERGDFINIDDFELKIRSVIKRTIKTIEVKNIKYKRND